MGGSGKVQLLPDVLCSFFGSGIILLLPLWREVIMSVLNGLTAIRFGDHYAGEGRKNCGGTCAKNRRRRQESKAEYGEEKRYALFYRKLHKSELEFLCWGTSCMERIMPGSYTWLFHLRTL
jgi:hypothetical protein